MGHIEIHDRVVELLRESEPQKVLDVPTGEGALANRIEELGLEVVCADLYPELFKAANIAPVKADLDKQLPFEAEEFDIVVCVEGLEHIENPANAVREFARVLRPGGRCIVSVPNIMNIEERMKWLISGYTSHFKPLSKPSLDEISEEFSGIEEVALHVNPIGYSELRYLLEKNRFELKGVYRDRPKRNMWLYLPLVWAIRAVSYFLSKEKRARNWTDGLNSDPVLYGGNTIIFDALKEDSHHE